MSDLTRSVDDLSAGVAAQGTALSSALSRIQEDFSAIQAKLDAALADDAEAQAAVARIQENVALMQQSTDALNALDVDPANPPAPDEPTPVPSDPVVVQPAEPDPGGNVVSG